MSGCNLKCTHNVLCVSNAFTVLELTPVNEGHVSILVLLPSLLCVSKVCMVSDLRFWFGILFFEARSKCCFSWTRPELRFLPW